MKQAYDKGGIQWIRKLPGAFADIDGVSSLEHDYDASTATIINALYISPRLLNSNAWHLYKIDVGGAVPKQLWHSYTTASAA